MTRLDRSLLVVLGLVALAAALVSLPRGEARAEIGASLDLIPLALGDWRGRMVADVDTLLPVDGRSLESTRRVYERGDRRVWLGVARYLDMNGPETRPALHAITAGRGATSVTRSAVRISLDGATTLPAMRVSTHYMTATQTTWYWYRLGRRVIGDEYSLRFWLAADTLLRRQLPLWLVRVSTTNGEEPDDFVRLLAPHLDTLTRVAERNNS